MPCFAPAIASMCLECYAENAITGLGGRDNQMTVGELLKKRVHYLEVMREGKVAQR